MSPDQSSSDDIADVLEVVRAVTVAAGPYRPGSPAATGTIDCPVCGGVRSLGYSRSMAGHITAACRTPNCAAVMQ